jgi:hypothetical protein
LVDHLHVRVVPAVARRPGGKALTWPGQTPRTGTAHILDDDDPGERQRFLAQANLARSWCVRASAAMGTSPLTVRIDLDTR